MRVGLVVMGLELSIYLTLYGLSSTDYPLRGAIRIDRPYRQLANDRTDEIPALEIKKAVSTQAVAVNSVAIHVNGRTRPGLDMAATCSQGLILALDDGRTTAEDVTNILTPAGWARKPGRLRKARSDIMEIDTRLKDRPVKILQKGKSKRLPTKLEVVLVLGVKRGGDAKQHNSKHDKRINDSRDLTENVSVIVHVFFFSLTKKK
jgi:hypothetical protein